MAPSTNFQFGSTSIDGESMFGTAAPEDSHDEYYSRCRWYGERFLKCILAEGLFTNAADRARGEDLDSELMQAMINFPYAECVEHVDVIDATAVPGDLSHSNSYTVLMTKIGALLEQGDGAARHKLAVVIQNHGGTGDSILHNAKKMPPPPPTVEDLALDDDKNIAMYTMRLHEWCQRRGKSLDWDDKHLSFDPPLWEISLKVEGAIFTGKAKNRKQARHIASKKACKELRIDA